MSRRSRKSLVDILMLILVFTLVSYTVYAEGDCVSAVPETDWTVVDLSTLCPDDINNNINSILSVGRFAEIDPNKLSKDNINNNIDRFIASQFSLGEKDFIVLIAPENIKKILNLVTSKQKPYLTLEQLEFEDTLAVIKDIHNLNYDILHTLFEHRGLNISIINASTLNYSPDILIINKVIFNTSGCNIATCSVMINETLYLIQDINEIVDDEEINITTRAYINGSVSLDIIDEAAVFILNDDDSKLEILGRIEGFNVSTKSHDSLVWGNVNEGKLIITAEYFKSFNSALLFAERYIFLGDSETFFYKNLSLKNVTLHPQLTGYQSEFIDINNSLEMATIGYDATIHFSEEF